MNEFKQCNVPVLDAYIINDLLNAGFMIASVAPHRDNSIRTVFYLVPDEGLVEAITKAYDRHYKSVEMYD